MGPTGTCEVACFLLFHVYLWSSLSHTQSLSQIESYIVSLSGVVRPDTPNRGQSSSMSMNPRSSAVKRAPGRGIGRRNDFRPFRKFVFSTPRRPNTWMKRTPLCFYRLRPSGIRRRQCGTGTGAEASLEKKGLAEMALALRCLRWQLSPRKIWFSSIRTSTRAVCAATGESSRTRPRRNGERGRPIS